MKGHVPSPSELYELLLDRYGQMDWWPSDGPFEIVVGAILTQRTSWKNVERALANLRTAGIMDIDAISGLDHQELEALVRPSGTYRQKARRLRALSDAVRGGSGRSLGEFLARPTDVLRSDLLGINGIGPETADSIILYAARRPVFVVDAYTRRILDRIGVMTGPSYDDVARWFTEGIPEDADLYNNFHAVLVEHAKAHCRVRPVCDGCPAGLLCQFCIDMGLNCVSPGQKRYQE